MKVLDLKMILEKISVSNLINECYISTDGKVLGIDSGRTIIVDMEYLLNLDIPKDLSINNIAGVLEDIKKYSDDSTITIKDNRLYIIKGYKFNNVLIGIGEKPKYKLPEMGEGYFDIIVENIDHNILNNIGNLRPKKLINEIYFFYVDNGKLMIRVGDENESNIGDEIASVNSTVSDIAKYTMNVSQCFKNIETNAKLSLKMKEIMVIETISEKYRIKYYLAPRV